MSYSQLNQDLKVISFFNNTKELFFVDIGANDGKTLSNTYLLEKKYKWSGICSEPSPRVYEKLSKCRHVHCDNNAVFSKSGIYLNFSESSDSNGLLSGITECIDQYYEVKNCNQIIVKTITFQELLVKYKAPDIIQYLSLDTEGSELEILKSVDFSQFTFLYINVEHNYIEPRRTQMRNLLLNKGYVYMGENKWDDDYIHDSTIIGMYYFSQDYTKPILIKRIGENTFSVSSPYWEEQMGKFENGSINWSGLLGTGKFFYTYIDYGNGNIWHRDNRKI